MVCRSEMWRHARLIVHLKLLPSLLLPLLLEFGIVNLVFLIHQIAQLLDLGSEELSFFFCSLEVQVIFQQACLDKLVLDVLDLSDQIEITSPAWHLLVDLLVFVHDSNLLSEMLFIELPVHLNQISSIVELFVVYENICL